jgi:rhodanese-related sulfurtransferase
MNVITGRELHDKLKRREEFKLVMTLSEFAYETKRIPGSLRFASLEETARALEPSDEVVVYCADVHCAASIYAYRFLERKGYVHVRRYAGGIADWEASGYPLERGKPERVPAPAAATRDAARRARGRRACACFPVLVS